MTISVSKYGRFAALIECESSQVAKISLACVNSKMFTEVVPAECTVLVCWQQGVSISDVERICNESDRIELAEIASELVKIPTKYDGADLDEVASRIGISVEGVVALHSSTIFYAAFAGFAPGFMYCTGLPTEFVLPRRDTPRTKVPRGTVAIADIYCGIYPIDSPGGWNLLGTTSVPLFDAHAARPSLIVPGDRVQFVPVAQ